MPDIPVKISAAYWTRPDQGCVLLEDDFPGMQDWDYAEATPPAGLRLPPLALYSETLQLRNLRPHPPVEFGRLAGYYRRGNAIVFCVDPERYGYFDFARDGLFVAGDFNGWQKQQRWSLKPRTTRCGQLVWEVAVGLDQLRELAGGQGATGVSFKFLTRKYDWIMPCFEAPNREVDAAGNANYRLDFRRSGAHVFVFDVVGGRTFVGEHVLVWQEKAFEQHITPQPGLGFFHLKSDLPLGVHVERAGAEAGSTGSAAPAVASAGAHGHAHAGVATTAATAADTAAKPAADSGAVQTVFRLFAPRATAVMLELRSTLEQSRLPVQVALELREDMLTWEARLPGNLHGMYYQYRVSGEQGVLNAFDPSVALLDPYALATVSEKGPGIVIDRSRLPRHAGQAQPFTPPRYEDASIVECHVRDLLANAPIELTAAERRGFAGLTRWLQNEDCYLRALGTNVVELQPCQQFDSTSAKEYHWGYMTNNYFAPCAWYARKPAQAVGEGSAIGDFAALSAALHEAGLALVLDVVYNHVGVPAHLAMIDKYYYFVVDPHSGEFNNDSGCGNTLRADAAMSRHLIIESLRHLIETFDIDGMRFDLAELLGIGTLHAVEKALREVKPSLIFIAEPWSFRGNMQHDLHHSSYAFWNDGFREFAADYVRGGADTGGLQYFMNGSVGHAALWPSQSVNYVASHDDMCWPDKITENPDHDATDPTCNDRLRTHLAAALVFGSNGIPMWPQGLDFLHSKRGVNNTYLRGDLNALDYARAERFAATVAYVRGWIAFRHSVWGEVLRLKARAGDEYLYRFNATHGNACALLFNADCALGGRRLLLAVNPHVEESATILLPADLDVRQWTQFADQERFSVGGVSRCPQDLEDGNRFRVALRAAEAASAFAATSAGDSADIKEQGSRRRHSSDGSETTTAATSATAPATAVAPASSAASTASTAQAAQTTQGTASASSTATVLHDCEAHGVEDGHASHFPPRVWTIIASGTPGAPAALVLPPLSCCLFGQNLDQPL